MNFRAKWLGGIALALIAAPLQAQDTPTTTAPVTEADLLQHIQILASDEYEGREPGTAGEAKTIGYLANQWAKAGLKGGLADGNWYDPVELIESYAGPSKLTFKNKKRTVRVAQSAMVLRSRDATTHLENLPLIFAGYGVDADGKVAADVSGKLVLMLMKEPASGDLKDWRLRRDAVAKAGAAAVLAISSEKTPSARVREAYGSTITIESRQSAAAVDGVIGEDGARALFKASKVNWDEAMTESGTPNFAGLALTPTANIDASTTVRRFKSHNVIGKIPGKFGSEKGAVLFLGHWDHLGICAAEATEDRICNGAVDNASGMAVLIEAAKRLAKTQPDRDIYFLGTTAEEMGLLGAYAFAEKPVVPLDKIVAAFNVDSIAVAPKGEKSAILGRGTTPLDADIDKIAVSLGRTPETGTDSNVMIQRQDGWALKSRGVPVVMLGGSFADMKKLMAYLQADYHGPGDEVGDKLVLSGAAEDADLHVAVGQHFSNVTKWPATTGTAEPTK